MVPNKMEWRRRNDAVYGFDLTSAQDKRFGIGVDCVQCRHTQRLHAFRLLGQSGPQDERDRCTTRISLSRKSIQKVTLRPNFSINFSAQSCGTTDANTLQSVFGVREN